MDRQRNDPDDEVTQARFLALLDPRLNEMPGDTQARAEASFGSALASSSLHPANASGASDRVLIGVATYSRDDMRMLDRLHEAVATSGTIPIPAVEVFSVAACGSQGDFQALIPGVGLVYQTPVLGVFRGSTVVESHTGKPARMWLERTYKL